MAYPKLSSYTLPDMLDLARQICGDGFRPYGNASTYSQTQWLQASIEALETKDAADLAYMCWHEDMWDHFLDWINADIRNRDEVDFDEWLEARR